MSIAIERVEFRANPSTGVARRIDRQAGEAGVIFGAVVSRVGEMRGHGVNFDRRTLGMLAALAAVQSTGVKARFGHPDLLGDGLGTYLGRWRNVRPDQGGDVLLGDLWLSSMARKSPQGDLAEYVLDLAEADPGAFGSSPVCRIRRESVPGENLEVARPDALYAIDVVDDPASGAEFFSSIGPTLAQAESATVARLRREYREAGASAIRCRTGIKSEADFVRAALLADRRSLPLPGTAEARRLYGR